MYYLYMYKNLLSYHSFWKKKHFFILFFSVSFLTIPIESKKENTVSNKMIEIIRQDMSVELNCEYVKYFNFLVKFSKQTKIKSKGCYLSLWKWSSLGQQKFDNETNIIPKKKLKKKKIKHTKYIHTYIFHQLPDLVMNFNFPIVRFIKTWNFFLHNNK